LAQGKINRKNALPFAALIGVITLLVEEEPGTSDQFVRSPAPGEFVCICNRQPM
jgi:hypothetical protein